MTVARTLTILTIAAVAAAGLRAAQTPSSDITAVQGIKVGHHTLKERPTGCTVVLVDGDGAVGGVSQRGGAPGTRETNLLDPANLVDKVNAIVLSGGSAFGLDAATGTVRWLEEHNVGWNVGVGKVPIVPAAILFDLTVGGDAKVRPTADCGYRAAAAASDRRVEEGSIGAGAGATVGKLGAAAGGSRKLLPMKGGIGSASIALPNGVVVGAIAAVNAAGDIIDPKTGAVIAGVRDANGTLADVRTLLRSGAILGSMRPGTNTTIAVVATNATLSKADVHRMALMADDGLARAIVPSHTISDGDTVFALATGRRAGAADASVIGALAAEVLSEAIVRAATQATSIPNFPAARDLPRR